jgi:uncharacterized protein
VGDRRYSRRPRLESLVISVLSLEYRRGEYRFFDRSLWETRFEKFVAKVSQADAAHDLAHVYRVVANAERLAALEHARLEIVLPAAWLHDCRVLPKGTPLRHTASALAARAAGDFLRDRGYTAELIPAIEHAIEAPSFSARVTPRTREAMVVQDADRLDALGAIGIARCLTLGGAMGRALYDPHELFPETRTPDDADNVLDHFYLKLLRLADTMTTTAGRAEARRRTAFMHEYLRQLGQEISFG